ncbi:MAG: diguanylate cyclase [Chromatiales bacterium]
MTGTIELKPVPVDRRVVLLQKLVRERREVITPERSVESPSAHVYPVARAALECRPGEELAQLEQMADLGLLERTFFDKIHICNICQHHALNFREICRRCGSSNVDIVDIIHHYRCGYNAPEAEFQDGMQYTCPKCEQKLRHIGVDYERPTSNYLCRVCSEVFADPKVDCQCLKCGAGMPAENVTVLTIHEYRTTTKGVLVASKGRIDSEEERGVLDADLGIYRYSYFEERLGQEMAAARRYKRPLVLLAAGIDHYDRLRGQFGDMLMARRLKEVADLTRETLRESDCAAFHQGNILLMLLSDTPLEGAYVVAERMRRGIMQRPTSSGMPECTLSVSVVATRGDLAGPHQFVELVMDHLRVAREYGGNVVWPRATL